MSEYAPCTPPLGSLQLLEKEAETSHGCQTLHTALPTVCNVIIIIIIIFSEIVTWPKKTLDYFLQLVLSSHSHTLLFSILTISYFYIHISLNSVS